MSSANFWSCNLRFCFFASINRHSVLRPVSKWLVANYSQKRQFIANRVITVDTALRAVFLTRTVSNAARIAFAAKFKAIFLAAADLPAICVIFIAEFYAFIFEPFISRMNKLTRFEKMTYYF